MWKLLLRRGELVLLLAMAVLWLPWWVVLAAAVAAALLEPQFYEIIIPAFIFDLWWGAPGVGWFGVHFFFTALALVGVYLLELVKPRLRWS